MCFAQIVFLSIALQFFRSCFIEFKLIQNNKLYLHLAGGTFICSASFHLLLFECWVRGLSTPFDLKI